jgi:hypothetical protein
MHYFVFFKRQEKKQTSAANTQNKNPRQKKLPEAK